MTDDPAAQSIHSPPLAATASEVSSDTACMACGYNLRGIMTTGRCPECGGLVSDSLRGDLLRFAHPDWLEAIRFGTSLKLWNIGLTMLGMVAAVNLVAVGVPPPIIGLVGFASSVLGVWASFAITTQEPRISMQEDPVTLRKVIRLCAGAAFAGSVISFVDDLVGVGLVFIVITFVLTLGGIVSSFGELMYYRRFALRIPDFDLAKSTKTLMWVLPICIGLLLVLSFAAAVISASAVTAGPATSNATIAAPAGPMAALGIGICFVALLMLVGVLWYVRLLTKYSRAFKTAVAEARGGVAFRELSQ